MRKITDLNLKPEKILATHGHFDHLLATFELQSVLKIPFLVHKKDLFLVEEIQKRASYWLGTKRIEPSPQVDEFLNLAAAIPIIPEIQEFDLKDANQALMELKQRQIRGAKVLVME